MLPDEPPADGARARSKDPLGDVYSTRDVAKLFSLSQSRLRYWERSGFITRSVRTGKQRFYSFEDLIGIRAAKELLDEGVALQSVRRSLEALRESLPRVARPLSSLRIVADGQSLLVRDDRGSYEPTTGQLRLDFEVSDLRDDVVRVLRRGAKQSDFALAYQHYLEGCRFDEDEKNLDRAEAVAVIEELGERVLQQRQGADAVGDIGDDLGHEAGLELHAHPRRGPVDGLLELLGDIGVITSVPTRSSSPMRRWPSGRS